MHKLSDKLLWGVVCQAALVRCQFSSSSSSDKQKYIVNSICIQFPSHLSFLARNISLLAYSADLFQTRE